MKAVPFLLCGALALSGCASFHHESSSGPIGVATLKPTQGNDATATATFTPRGNQVIVDVRARNLAPGKHGIHIHEKGDCSAPDATSAGAHFDPDKRPHGDPHGDLKNVVHHAGDLGNLTADANGNASLNIALPKTAITMEQDAPHSIVGRALVIHADPDDFVTQPAGNAGRRVACGVITAK